MSPEAVSHETSGNLGLTQSLLTLPRSVGFPKTGLRVDLVEEGSVLSFRGRPDPVLLYFVFGIAVLVAVLGSVIVSPQYGLAGVMLLSVLFLPLIFFVGLGALRLRTECVIDRGGQTVRVIERSYGATIAHEWPLAALTRAVVTVRPPSGFAGGGSSYELHLDFGGERYRVDVAVAERGIRRAANRVASFLGVPVETERLVDPSARPAFRHVALIAALFALPVMGSTLGFSLLFRERPVGTSLMIVSMSALVVCQVAAILAYSYDRARRGRGD